VLRKMMVLCAVLVLCSVSLAAANVVPFAMCRPSVGQIMNIEEMYEKDIIPLARIKLIGVYHESETTNYEAARKYVEKRKLDWVSFNVIKGEVGINDLFKANKWTAQFKQIFTHTEGIIFTGGADIPPAIYGDSNNLLTVANTAVRSYYEISFLFHLLGSSRNESYVPLLESNPQYAILGICLGAQSMNVACGGTMFQDIPSEVYKLNTMEQVLASGQDKVHSARYVMLLNPRVENLPSSFHRIKFKKGSLFIKEMNMKKKATPLVLSSHHQALKKIGKNLRIIATSMDGKIVESIAHKKYTNVLGIQFHPEPYRLFRKGLLYRKAPGSPLNFNLREYLMANPPSMAFHKKIWQWFAGSLQE
jgi:putative glutamine amidotransferase